ncbi:MAG TPA: thioester reductase, partial [Candidatus Latescibacteria bacterium]|nr:thioester reductase [Candidatus Latescibacterota bacterium]
QAVAVGWPLDAGRADGVVGFIDRPIDDSSVLMVKLADRLPDYMVPKAVYSVGEFPLNSNGKVDRQALAKSIEAQERGTDA